ncbi:MAG: hypothetical protein LBH43_14760, partial [Treponema sp.]|nr:hypothetical protein [Treponema sp.]
MKKIVLLSLFIFILIGTIFPQSDKDSSFTTFFGFSMIPYTLWGSKVDDDYASNFMYNFEPGIFYILEFGLKHKSEIEMAVSLDVDNNNIEKLSNIVGRLGFKRITSRVSFGSLIGSGHWEGNPLPYQTPTVDFDSKYFQIDLLYNAYNVGMSTYFGICYISYELPVIFDSDSLGDGSGKVWGIYDTAPFHGYGISAYGDTLNAATKNKKEGFGFWLNFGTALTFGTFKINDEIWEIRNKYREEINQVYNSKNSFAFLAGNYEITAGLFYLKNMKRASFGGSAGYSLWGRMIMMGQAGNDIGE